jgi:cyanocobalamin reductase (cyanide-eliminating) / alkylcobalamin dealkylase
VGLSHQLATLAAAGLDVVRLFDTRTCAGGADLAWAADPARPLGLVIGNTRALWPVFLAARRADAALATSPDPIDRYTERTLAHVFAGEDARIHFAHVRAGDRFLPFQRLAVAAGLAALAPTQLLVHPEYGPWFALRALVALPADAATLAAAVSASQPPALPCRCDGDRCTLAFERARTSAGPDGWRDWLAVRDGCSAGRAYRYSDPQIAYHYTKDPRWL